MSSADEYLATLYGRADELWWLATARSPIFEAMRDHYRCSTDCRIDDWRDDANDWSPDPPEASGP